MLKFRIDRRITVLTNFKNNLLEFENVLIIRQYIIIIIVSTLLSHITITRLTVAQLVERRAVTREVVSSTPAGPSLRVLK